MNAVSQHIQTNGVSLHTLLVGPEDGPLAVLLHGFPDFSYGWHHQIGPLARAGFRVVIPDQRGYNLSDKPRSVDDYRLDTLASDVTGLLDQLGRETCYLAGHDWGAAVAWQVAARHPGRVERLAILNVPHPAVMVRMLRQNPNQLLKSWYIFFFQLRGLAERILARRDFTPLIRMLQGSALPGTFTPEDLACYREAYRQPGTLTAMLNWYRAMFQQAWKHRRNPGLITPEVINVPTLMLWGRLDVALDESLARPSIGACQAESGLVFFDNASHWVQYDEAEAVSRHLIAFFRDGTFL